VQTARHVNGGYSAASREPCSVARKSAELPIQTEQEFDVEKARLMVAARRVQRDGQGAALPT